MDSADEPFVGPVLDHSDELRRPGAFRLLGGQPACVREQHVNLSSGKPSIR
jgi:hypothetical protein